MSGLFSDTYDSFELFTADISTKITEVRGVAETAQATAEAAKAAADAATSSGGGGGAPVSTGTAPVTIVQQIFSGSVAPVVSGVSSDRIARVLSILY